MTKRGLDMSILGRLGANLLYASLPVVILVMIWEYAARFGHVSPIILPPVETIMSSLFKMLQNGMLWIDLSASLRRLLYSVAVGAIIGAALGMLMGSIRIVERILVGPVNFLLSIPGTALFPLVLLWFGLSEAAIVVLLAYEVVLTMVSNVWTGVKTIDVSLIRAGRAFGATGVSMLWRVLLPASLPSIISALRLSFSRSWRILIVSEMLVSLGAGLGYRLFWARELFETDVIYADLIVIGLVGLLIERFLLRTLEIRTVQRWGVLRELT